MVKLTTTLALVGSLASALTVEKRADVDSFVTTERAAALDGILANMGPSGRLATNASRGVVIAGPGIVNPDYRYSWTRDSAMTLHALVEEFIAAKSSLRSNIEDYVYAEAVRQTIYDAMGPLYPWGTGLGEPKYNINLTRFNGVWGRPQRDGPALRAITLMEYMGFLLNRGGASHAKNDIWPIVQNDLNYVAMYWHEIGYDLWEEVAGLSFFTIQASWRALSQGAAMARRLGKSCEGYQAQAANAGCFLATNYWNATGGYISGNIDQPAGTSRSNIDVNPLLSAMENFDIDGSCDNRYYQPCSSRILATHKVYVDAFRSLYPINNGSSANAAIATGRYPEDTYYGGNPWYLCTLGAAEVLYDAAAQFRHQGQLTIDSTSLSFFQQFYSSAKVGTYKAPRDWCKKSWSNGCCNWGMSGGDQRWGSPSYGMSGSGQGNQFSDILSAMTKYADGFIAVVQQYTPSNGSLSEQYNRTTGEPLSAYALTWSFASVLTVAQRRSGQYPASWNSRSVAQISNSCPSSPPANTFVGNFAAATSAGAPSVSTACTVQITFNVNASTTFGQNIYITGDVAPLGNWAKDYQPMAPDFYTSQRALWYSIIDVPGDTTVHYKYVHQNSNSYSFEVQNRTVTTPSCGNGRIQIATDDAFSSEGTNVTENYCNPDVVHCW